MAILMEPLLTAQTRQNILTAMDWIGIPHTPELVFSNEPIHNNDRSRVVMFDPHGLIRRFIEEHPNEFTRDAGSNHNKFGWKVRSSNRSTKNRGTPSLQFCRVDAVGGEYEYFYLTDLDEANPYCNFPKHAWECLSHMRPNATTDPAKIAAMLKAAQVLGTLKSPSR